MPFLFEIKFFFCFLFAEDKEKDKINQVESVILFTEDTEIMEELKDQLLKEESKNINKEIKNLLYVLLLISILYYLVKK